MSFFRLFVGRAGKLVMLLLLSTTVTVCGRLPSVRADDEVTILKVSSETADSVTFQISLPRRSYAPGEDIVINYKVINESRKIVYLVTEPKSRLSFDRKKEVIRLESPVKYQDEFNQYDNDLIRIPSGRTCSGKLIIKVKEVPRDEELESDDWSIQVRFAYVINASRADIAELLECRGTKYSFPCLGKLLKVSTSLTVGDLMVEVKH